MPPMKALTYHGDKTIRLEQVPDPEILEPGDVIVRVELCAVCGSDLHVYHGRERGLDHGCVMGHEFVGEILELGSAPGDLARGERVLSPFTTSCGNCPPCRIGLTSRCVSGELFGWVQEGRGLQGGQAEYVRVPLAASTLVPIPDGVDNDAALLLGDVFSTGWFCAEQAALQPGSICAVVGCGPVGLCAVMAASEMNAQRIFALDRVPERLALAQRLGATAVDIERDDPVAVLREATAGLGADAVMEVVGSAAAIRVSSATCPSFRGVLKSTRTNTRLPAGSMSCIVSLFITRRAASDLAGSASHQNDHIDAALGVTPFVVVP